MSAAVYILRDQEERYLDTQNQWVTGDAGEPPFFTPHRDVALNQLFELTLHDPQLRGRVEACPVNARGKPLLQASGTVDLLGEGDAADASEDEVSETTAESGEVIVEQVAEAGHEATEQPL